MRLRFFLDVNKTKRISEFFTPQKCKKIYLQSYKIENVKITAARREEDG